MIRQATRLSLIATALLIGACNQPPGEPDPQGRATEGPQGATEEEELVLAADAPPPIKCENSCSDPGTCPTNACNAPCNREINSSEGVHLGCAASTCGASSGLPCSGNPADPADPPQGGGGGGGGPANCQDFFSRPAAFEVFLYEHSDFEGRCWVVRGPVRQSWIEDAGIPNDTISSLKTGPNMLLTLFDHINFGRSRGTWTSDAFVRFVGDADNDQASSFIITARR